MDKNFFLTNDIDEDSMAKFFNDVTNELSEIPENVKNVNVIVNISSFGGTVECGFAIYDFLHLIDLKPRYNVITRGIGMVESTALLVFMAAGERRCTPNTIFLLHPLYFTGDGFNDHALSQTVTEIKESTKLNDRMFDMIKDKCLLSSDKFKEIKERNEQFYFDATEAKRLFIVNSNE